MGLALFLVQLSCCTVELIAMTGTTLNKIQNIIILQQTFLLILVGTSDRVCKCGDIRNKDPACLQKVTNKKNALVSKGIKKIHVVSNSVFYVNIQLFNFV